MLACSLQGNRSLKDYTNLVESRKSWTARSWKDQESRQQGSGRQDCVAYIRGCWISLGSSWLGGGKWQNLRKRACGKKCITLTILWTSWENTPRPEVFLHLIFPISWIFFPHSFKEPEYCVIQLGTLSRMTVVLVAVL